TVVAHEMTVADLAVVPTGGRLDGLVRDDGTGNPIAGALALVLDRGGLVERVVAADDEGTYSVAGLRSGAHLIGFVDPSGEHEIRFHAGASSVPDATPVDLAAGGGVAVDASLPAQEPGVSSAAVTGTVVEEGTGDPVPGAVV